MAPSWRRSASTSSPTSAPTPPGASRWARNLTFLGLLGGSYFDSDRQETTALQGQLGAGYGLTPALDISGTIGPSVAFTDVEEPIARSDTEVAAVWDVNLDYRPSADASVALGLFQQFDPSATGELNLRTGITVGFDYALTRYTLFSLPALIQRQEPVEGVTDTPLLRPRPADAGLSSPAAAAVRDLVPLSLGKLRRRRHRRRDVQCHLPQPALRSAEPPHLPLAPCSRSRPAIAGDGRAVRLA